jgi:hypothetical protein
MPRFFFHVYDNIVALDDEGLELESAALARNAAVRAARQLAAEEIVSDGVLHLRHRIEVEDEEGRPVLTVPFAAAFKVIEE